MKKLTCMFFLLFFSFSSLAEVIPAMFDIYGDELTITIFQDKVGNRPNAVEEFFKDLKLEISRPMEGIVEKEFRSNDQKFYLVCAEMKIDDSHYFNCWIKVGLKSNDQFVVTTFPYGGANISAQARLAFDLNHILSGHPARCWDLEYAENFKISLCPNMVNIKITPK